MFKEVLAGLGSISLEEMDGVKLMNRTDSKFLTDQATLLGILADAGAQGYRALETEGSKIATYDTLYYDTPALQMFLDHHNRRLVRQKVRTRIYFWKSSARTTTGGPRKSAWKSPSRNSRISARTTAPAHSWKRNLPTAPLS